jgi:hypothetical protein
MQKQAFLQDKAANFPSFDVFLRFSLVALTLFCDCTAIVL